MYLSRSRDGVASCTTMCRALNSVIWKTLSSLSLDSTSFGLILFPGDSCCGQQCFEFSAYQLRENDFFPSRYSRSAGFTAWLESLANSWGNHCGKGMECLGCLGLSHAHIPGAPWWSQPDLNCMNWKRGHQGQSFPKEIWVADIRMRKNGCWAGESNRSPPLQL